MSLNIARSIGGPALIRYAGRTFRSKADIKLSPSLTTFVVETDLHPGADTRVSGQELKLSFTPEGLWDLNDLAVLFPAASLALGDLLTPRREFTVTSSTDIVTSPANGLRDAAPVRVSAEIGSTLPTGLTENLLVYWHPIDADTGYFYDTAAHATAAAETGRIDLTTDGTGIFAMVLNEPLQVLARDGELWTFHNACVTKQPSINGSTKNTLFSGDVEFALLPKNATDHTTADSIYTRTGGQAWSEPAFDKTKLLTQKFALTWGSTFTGLSLKNGFTADFGLTTEPVVADGEIVASYRLKSRTATLKAQPMGLSLSALLTALKVQGSGADLGRSLAGGNLDLISAGAGIRLYSAALTGGLAQWNSGGDRIGELPWQANDDATTGKLFAFGAPTFS
jgi:hypothetical protein